MNGSDYGGHTAGEIVANRRLVRHAGINNHAHHLWFWQCLNCLSEFGPSTLHHLKRSTLCRECRLVKQNNPRWKGYKDITGVWLYQYKSDAEKRGRRWDVTPEQLWELWESQQGACAYTGWPLTHGVDASLDRKDNSVGYVYENVQWVHKEINKMKSDFQHSRFLELTGAVSNHSYT